MWTLRRSSHAGFGSGIARTAADRRSCCCTAWVKAAYFAYARRAPYGWLLHQIRLARSPDFLRVTIDSLRAGLAVYGQSDLVVDRLHEIGQPVVWGEQDGVVPVAHAHRAARLLSHGRCRTIPHCGHMPHLERPQHFRRVLDEFLSGVASGAQLRGSAAPGAPAAVA